MRRSDSHLSPGFALAYRFGFVLMLAAATATTATAQRTPAPAPPAPPAAAAPPAAPAPPVPAAGQPLRQQVEERFEVLPVSDGLLLKPKQPMDGIRALEVRDGQLAIDGREAEADDLERRIGRAAATPVRALLELDPDELGTLFGLSTAPPPSDNEDVDALHERVDQQMEQRRAEIERQQEEIRRRIEEEMNRHADDVQQDVARQVEHAVRRGMHRGDGDARVVMGTPVHVRPGESTGDVVAIGGGITVEGEVMGDAVSVGGSEDILGLVSGSAVSVGGTVHLGPNARVMGDVVSVGGSVEREPGAEILGKVTEVSLWQGLSMGTLGGNWNWRRGAWGVDGGNSYFDGALMRMVRCIVFVLVLILLGVLASVIARHPLERTSAAAAAEPWKAGIVGMLAVILFVPAAIIVLVLLAVSIIGIPLILLWPFAIIGCFFAAFFGYIASAHALARWSEYRFGWRIQGPVTTVVLGLFLLHGAWLMARLVDVVDSSRNVGGFLRLILLLFWLLVNIGAFFVGIGAVILARRRGYAPVQPLIATPPPLPPPPSSRGHELPVVEGPAVESLRSDEGDWQEPFADFDEPEPATSATAVTAVSESPASATDEPDEDVEEPKRQQA
ncbi:MAG TPA: polymer-forming cytoskeletal protein [Thermoanaerobaculia bacterium]|jgi:hypothetical protein|nr:polymer-forming cytoskeletal protein [Thermoanaerobaculia bacterium]